MTTEPEIVELPERPYAAIAASVTMETLGTAVPPLNQEVFAWLGQQGVPPAGPPFWKYNVIDMDRRLEVEAGVPLAEPVPGDDRVLAAVLPAGRYATLRHVGHPDTLMAATAALLDWAAAKGLKWDMSPSPGGERWGCRLEVYHSDPANEPDMTKWVTELAFRLADESLR
jgi:effector-binding domain-containing protein